MGRIPDGKTTFSHAITGMDCGKNQVGQEGKKNGSSETETRFRIVKTDDFFLEIFLLTKRVSLCRDFNENSTGQDPPPGILKVKPVTEKPTASSSFPKKP